MIDTHAHIFQEYYENIEEIIKNMENNIIIISGTNKKDNEEVIKICEQYENVYGTIGIHPTEVDTATSSDFEWIEENIKNEKIVAIGEIGLDYYWEKENKEKQKEIFIRQIKLAKKYNKAIVVHSRDAIGDVYEIIKKYAKDIPVDIHCYSGSIEMANKFIELGCRLGIGGVLTFKNNVHLKETVKAIPLEAILLETDSPFLTPEPFRGKKNEPRNILYVAQKIAEIKEVTLETVLKKTTENAISQFDVPRKM